LYSLALVLFFDQRLSSDPRWFVLSNALLALGIGAFAAFHHVYISFWRDQITADSDFRLGALQARTRPHFLFNILNTISSLIQEQPVTAENATLDLADLMRTGLRAKGEHFVSEEIDLVRRYLRLEGLRLGSRLKVEWALDADFPLSEKLPPLLLQPLIENAIVHGISRRAEGGTLRIEGKRIRFGRIRFTVTNPLADPDSRPAEGNNTALENIRQRLALAYEERYGLKTRIEDGHFIAELTIPIES
ncbi:MAG: sensor histidine kinase, partial [Wenzhouxiangella sp.]